jgi:hypothetical protein
MCDLQWRFAETDIPPVLDGEELVEYRSLLKECVKQIDDDIIRRQKHIVSDVKMAILAMKYDNVDFVTKANNDIYYGFDNNINAKFSRLIAFLLIRILVL